MRLDFEILSIIRRDLDEVQCMKIFDFNPNLFLKKGQNPLTLRLESDNLER